MVVAYQAFIDLLTIQGKTASSAFLQLYSSLSEAPDPYPLLEASVDSLLVSEDTLPKLTFEKDELQRRVSKLTTQLEDIEKRFGEERALRRSLEENQESRFMEVEASWTKVLEERQNNWDSREQFLQEKVENQDRLLKEIKANYEVSQRLDRDNGSDSNGLHNTAAAAELEITSSELDKATARLAETEARNEQLRLELAKAASQTRSSNTDLAVEDEPAFLRLQSENSSLLRKLDSVRFEREAEKRAGETNIRQITRQRAELDNEIQELRSKIQKRADYDELRRELDVIRSIEFATEDDDEEVPQASMMNGSANKGGKVSLEQLLLAKNKKLSSDMTILRVSRQELERQLDTLREELSKTNAELERSQHLSSTLENDLLKVQEQGANVLPSSTISVAGTYTSRHPQSSRRGRSSPTSSIISGFETHPRTPPTTLEALRTGEPIGGGTGILPMIQAQRDRFKQKNTQLEEELSRTYATVTSLRQEMASLQKDNLNLYEKTRYISAYSRNQPGTATSSSAYSQRPTHTAVQVSHGASSDSSFDRYRWQYEASISPFAAFRGRESARAYKRMSLPERMIFSITRMVLATRTSRNLFATYCLALHILVFLMLYWTGNVEVEKHATNLGAAGVGAVVVSGPSQNDGQRSSSGNWRQEDFHGG